MFCAKCGASLNDDAMQCDKCGAPVRIRPAAETREEESSWFSVPDEKALESRLPDAEDRSGRKQKKKKRKSVREDTFRDPVYCEDVTDELDVGEILRIVRGQEGSAEDGMGSEKDQPSDDFSGSRRDAADPQDVRRMDADDMDSDFAESHTGSREEPYKEPLFETDEDDFDSEDRYGGTAYSEDQFGEDSYDMEDVPLPLMERIRRRLAEAHHVRAEAADEKAMARHLARAEKYYDLQESMADQLREKRAQRAEELRLRRIRQDEAWHEQKWFEEALRKELEEERAAQRALEGRLEEENRTRAEESARLEQEQKARAEESARLEQEQKAYNTGNRAYDGQTEPVLAVEEAYLRKVRAARARRRAQEDAQDGVDRFLGKYGITKEAAVRIATLFLIVLLSMIYFLGRGGSTANAGSLPADGMTGAPALAEPEAGGEETEEESSVPTGGGDFQNTQQ